MPSAALRPSAMAVTTRSEPRTISPPAKIFGLLVWKALSLPSGAMMRPCESSSTLCFCQPFHVVWTETKRHDHRICRNDMFGTCHNLRAATAFGIRFAHFCAHHFTPLTLPLPFTSIPSGWTLNLNSTPSSRAFTSRREPACSLHHDDRHR